MSDNSKVQIGTGTDPSDPQSVITTIYRNRGYADDVYVDDVYVETNEMWMAAIGGPAYTYLDVDANIVAFDLSYYSTTFLQPGESYSFYIPPAHNYTRRFYHAILLQTNDTNGFRIVFQDFYIDNANQVQIGAGTDPSDLQSVITTIYGYRGYADDVYVEINKVWIAVIGTYDTHIEIDVNIVAFDLSSMSPLFNCRMSNMSVLSDFLCDGAYHCDHYEDESACNYSTTYLEPGESYSLDIPSNYIRRFYHATLLQTNDTNGFRIEVQYFYNGYSGEIQIGAGTDPSDLQSVITTIYGNRGYADDVYVETNEMWIAAIGGPGYTYFNIYAKIFAFDISTLFNCTLSVSSDVLCDGVYHCNHYEDESACNYSTFLQPGESYALYIPHNYISRFYHATLLQTNDTNGFRIVFQDFYIGYSDEIQIGTGTDPSDPQSVTTTIYGYRRYADDVYLETNEMWIAAIGGPDYTYLEINANIFAFDISTLINCPISNMSVSSDVLCDGVYHCNHYEDESACNYSTTYLEPGESYSLYIPYNYIRRFYNATLLQTNDTNGFRIMFQDFYIGYSDEIQIGTGTDPSDEQSVTTTIYGYRRYADDVYVETNEMWIAAIGQPDYTYLKIYANIFALDISTLINCPISNMSVSSDILCDGVYHCDHYEDESACNYSTTYLEPGESYSLYIPYNYIRRFYNATLLQTNETNGFRIVLQDFYIGYRDEIQIGRGTDPSDLQSVITTIYRYRYYADDKDDVYVGTNEMWMAAIGEPDYTFQGVNASIVAVDLSS
nr:uncharacterized protein LOC129272594 [Lytechinus pictus]